LEKNKIKLIALCMYLGSVSLLFAQQENLSGMQMQAREYRRQGFSLQKSGDLDQAVAMYQKAIELDPLYAIAFNDLGIIYESRGQIDRAEQSYIKALRVDSKFLSAITNLALLYENQRDLKKAAFFWQRRAELGSPDDPWTNKAKMRLNDIRLVSGQLTPDSEEQNVVDLAKDVTSEKKHLKYSDKALARDYYLKAKRNYEKENYLIALEQAVDAQLLDPSNKRISNFVDKLQIKLMSGFEKPQR